MKTLSGLPGKAVFRVMVTFAVVKCGHVRTNKTVPVRVVMSSDLKTAQVSKCSGIYERLLLIVLSIMVKKQLLLKNIPIQGWSTRP